MPFRCKCGRTFEKPDTFSSHTSGCAPFHHRRASVSSSPPPSLDMTNVRRLSMRSQPSPVIDSPMEYPSFMPTALSIQNAFEGVRRRSMSYTASLK
ncbi:uncharacterized protein BX664DRAFT_377045 [Halteromyces radiatus]|uniref:uncharacterized protein n=1 Tax=Halteromyces radiatus TaxID=101107 RepID=UPI0022205C49|nr:uncharacterized protein BX664DRAFT_377045 [Halteromyces radiatus]KAI8098747.1 hypothetical protein BX664DRAFT_377045 [Halteromyces radiatus]